VIVPIPPPEKSPPVIPPPEKSPPVIQPPEESSPADQPERTASPELSQEEEDALLGPTTPPTPDIRDGDNSDTEITFME
jgi:hypothetical protein